MQEIEDHVRSLEFVKQGDQKQIKRGLSRVNLNHTAEINMKSLDNSPSSRLIANDSSLCYNDTSVNHVRSGTQLPGRFQINNPSTFDTISKVGSEIFPST